MFEEQYKELADAIDDIAERIRALGEKVEASFYILIKINPLKMVYRQILQNLC